MPKKFSPIAAVALVLALSVQAYGQTTTIHIGMVELPPLAERTGDSFGFAEELFRGIFEPEGFRVVIEMKPWARVFEEGKLGKIDAVWPSIFSQERLQWFDYGPDLVVSRYVLLARVDSPIRSADLGAIKPYKIATLRGGITGSILDTATDYKLEPGTSFSENMQKLLAKRVDLMTIEWYNAQNLLKGRFKSESRKIRILQPTIAMTPMHLIVSKASVNQKAFLQAMESGFTRLQNSGELRRLKQKYGIL